MTNIFKNRSSFHCISDARQSDKLLSCIHLLPFFFISDTYKYFRVFSLVFYHLVLEAVIKASPDFKQFFHLIKAQLLPCQEVCILISSGFYSSFMLFISYIKASLSSVISTNNFCKGF